MTSFREKCYDILCKVPKGKVTTYKELAKGMGSKAHRAVGTAMAKNPNAPQVPCHRVVKSDGSIGNYAHGTDKKIQILRSEGVEVQNGKVVNFEEKLHSF